MPVHPDASHDAAPDAPEAHAATRRTHFISLVPMEQWMPLLVFAATCLLLTALLGIAVRLSMFIGHTLLIFSLGGLIAYALDPIVQKVRGPVRASGRRRSRAASASLVFAGIFGLFVLGGVLLSKPLAVQVRLLAEHHVEYEAHFKERLAEADDWLYAHGIHTNLAGYLNNPPPNMKGWGEMVAKNTLKTLERISKGVVEGLIVLVIALYFLIYSEEMREGTYNALPPRLQPYAEQWFADVNRILGGFVRGQLVLALTIGAMASVLCLAFGLRLWLLIGVFVVVASLIPVIGPFIGAIPAIIAALISPHAHFHPLVRVVLLLVAFGVINEIGSKILYPRLVGAALGLHEVLTLFILFAGFEVGGVIGVLFAAPLTALSYVTLTQLYRFWQGMPPVSVAQAAERGGIQAKQHGVP